MSERKVLVSVHLSVSIRFMQIQWCIQTKIWELAIYSVGRFLEFSFQVKSKFWNSYISAMNENRHRHTSKCESKRRPYDQYAICIAALQKWLPKISWQRSKKIFRLCCWIDLSDKMLFNSSLKGIFYKRVNTLFRFLKSIVPRKKKDFLKEGREGKTYPYNFLIKVTAVRFKRLLRKHFLLFVWEVP